MKEKEIKIPKQKLRGEDRHRTFSVRVSEDLYNDISDLMSKTELSRNEIINIILTEAIDWAVVDDK